MYIERKPQRSHYFLASICLFGATSTAMVGHAVSFYRAAQAVVPSEDDVHRSLETILRWRDAAGQPVEQIDTLLQQQAYDVALQSLQMPYLFQSATAALLALGCVIAATYVTMQNRRN